MKRFKPFTLHLSAQMGARVAELAEANGLTQRQVVIAALEKALEEGSLQPTRALPRRSYPLPRPL